MVLRHSPLPNPFHKTRLEPNHLLPPKWLHNWLNVDAIPIMDPLSIVASAITLVSAVSASLDLLRGLQSGQREVIDLIQDVSDFRAILEGVEKFLGEDFSHSRAPVKTLFQQVQNAEVILQKMDVIVQETLRQVPLSGRPNVRLLPAFRARSRLRALQQSLQTIKFNLATITGLIAA